MKNKTLIALAVACSPMFALAHNITVGQAVPTVEVASYGEIMVKDNDTTYQKWSSQDMLGKVRVIQAIAGRSSSKELNAPLMSAITAAKSQRKATRPRPSLTKMMLSGEQARL